MAKQHYEEQIICSFCGKTKKEAAVLLSGLEGHICDQCVDRAYDLLHEQSNGQKKARFKSFRLMKPAQMKEFIDQFVIGQDEAKRSLCVAVYNHYKRIGQTKKDKEDEVSIEKSNMVMIGETGTGKTYLARTIAKILDVPFCIADATVVTEAGYVGEDVESILARLYQAADGDLEATERGIVYIDEIDKIARKGDNPSITRDVSGEGVQQALLKLLEGSIANVPPGGGRKHPEQKYVQVNTENILFICGGAFVGIDKIISSRLNSKPIGFSSNNEADNIDKENLVQYVTAQDLKTFGLIPELIGRLPVIASLQPLNKTTLRIILTEPKNAIIKQYKKLMQMEHIKLDFDDEVLDYIVEKSLDFKLGARGLRTICEAIMTDAMFELPTTPGVTNFTITLDYAREKFEKSKYSRLKVA